MKKILNLLLEGIFSFFTTKDLKRKQLELVYLLKLREENFKSLLKHEIKTPVLAQMRAIEFLLGGNIGNLNYEQRELLEMTLNSCKHSYKIIMSQLYP